MPSGGAYQVEIILENLSDYDAKNVILVDLLPDSVTVSEFNIAPLMANQDTIKWLFETVPMNTKLLISFTATVSNFMPVGDNWFTNAANGFAENEDPTRLNNNTSTDSVLNRVGPPLPEIVDLIVTQTAITDSTIMENGEELPFVLKNEIFEIYITVKNKSNFAARDVILTEKLAELGLVIDITPAANESFADSLKWTFEQIDPQGEKTVKLDVQLDDNTPPGQHRLNYRASIVAANEDTDGQSDNIALLTVVNETVVPPVSAQIRSIPPVVDVGDSIHVEVQVDGQVASYDIWVHLPDGSIDSTFADNFIARNSLTPDQWLSVSVGYALQHLFTDAREEPLIFELRAVDLAGKLVTAQTTSLVISSNYLVLDRNIFKSEEEDFLGIRFKLSYRRVATLDIYDLNGRHMDQLTEDIYDGGWTTHYWNGLTQDGQKVGSGVYLVTLRSGEFNSYKKFILVR